MGRKPKPAEVRMAFFSARRVGHVARGGGSGRGVEVDGALLVEGVGWDSAAADHAAASPPAVG